MINFEMHRNFDGTINLPSAFDMYCSNSGIYPNDQAKARIYLGLIEYMYPIKSRQAAAVALATAMTM